MSGVTDGSSMNGSLSQQQAVFDITRETDVLLLLRTIHRSPLATDVKNILRDAIFAYKIDKTNSDATAITQLLASHNFTVVANGLPAEPTPAAAPSTTVTPAPQATEPTEPSSVLHFTRQAPSFGVSHVAATTQLPPPLEQPTPVSSVSPTTPIPAPVAPAALAANLEAASPQPVPQAAQEESRAEAPAESVVHTVPITKVVEEPPLPETPQTPTVTPSPATDTVPSSPAPAVAATGVSAEQRIKDIKHEVNGAVGNPITLIDIDDAIGREYMSALLDAMKQVAIDGTSAGSERALSRLEKAFQAVQTLLTTQGTKAVSRESKEVVEPAESASAEPVAAPVSSSATAPEVATKPVSSAPIPQKAAVPPMTTVAPVAAMQAAAAESNTPAATRTEPIASVSSPAADKKLATLIQEKQAAAEAAKPKPTGDPLLSEDVSRGLAQLLSEWSIFKRSGMFGTGPNGIEHPLYETLSQLTMSSVLTGRFEGVTPEVKRSINDYMNGWRYEEGIMHESGETFEHYLRRVVHHILEKRTKAVDGTS